MTILIFLSYIAVCIAVFTLLRIPLTRHTVPAASISGLLLTFALVQVLNYYHPYSGTSRQYLSTTPVVSENIASTDTIELAVEDRNLVAWFPESSLLRLKHGSEAEVSFDSIPGKVFAGLVQSVMPAAGEDWSRETGLNDATENGPVMIPVVIDITDRRFAWYVAQVPDGSRAQVAVYGGKQHELALVRKTLLRMSAWMNYLSPIS